MASLHGQAEAVKAAVASIATCTPATAVLLKDLLLPKEGENGNEIPTTTARAGRAAAKSRAPSRPQSRKATKPSADDKPELSEREKAVLATHVINATIKSLGEAARPPPAATPARTDSNKEELVKTATRNRLRRSNSSPMTPLRPRSLNRVSTSPVTTTKLKRSPSSAPMSNGCLSTVECARVAFSCLRTLQNSAKITLPELQLESGMSSFIGRLIGLGMMEHAVKELRILKRRLDMAGGPETKRPGKVATQDAPSAMKSVAELLDFRGIKASSPATNLIIATQLQVLRILSKTKRPANINDAMPYLRETFPTSPLNLLLEFAKSSKADQPKIARQLENLSQLLLSLPPSVSSSEDSTAQEPRLSISPATALELQTLGLLARLHWWKLAGHRGDVDKDIVSPLSRCLVAFVRRTQTIDGVGYKACRSAFAAIFAEICAQGRQPGQSSKSPLAAIYQALTKLARDVGRIGEAITWAEKQKLLLNQQEDSAAKCCAVAAQLLALQFKKPWQYLQDDALLKQVVGDSQGPLRGDSTELEDLLTNLCSVRKAAMAVLLGQVTDDDDVKYKPPVSTKDLLESFVLQLPRFCLRWLGKPPPANGATKDFLRFQQRRQLLLKSIHQVLDAAILLAKTKRDEQRISWELIEPILYDSSMLLENMGDIPIPDPARSYYLKISHLYFMEYKSLYQSSANNSKDLGAALRVLRRSIDCLKNRPSQEKEKGQLVFKLERMAEILKLAGRKDDVLGTLQLIRTSLVDDGVLRSVGQAMESLPTVTAWTATEAADCLSRTLQAISKLEQISMDWSVDLEEPERAAALEHRLQFILFGSTRTTAQISLSEPCVDALLQIYSAQRFPVRRMRTLVRLLSTNMASHDEFSTIQAHVDKALKTLNNGQFGEDRALAKYMPHLNALLSVFTGLFEAGLEDESISRALSSWNSMLGACQAREDMDQRIDNVPELLELLRSLADMARLKGHDDLLLNILQLSAGISKVAPVSASADQVNDNAALALQLINLGQSLSAAKILEESRELVQQADVSSHEAQTCFHLSCAEFSLAVGNAHDAGNHLVQAKESMGCGPSGSISRSRLKWILSQASLLYSLVALAKGEAHRALMYARHSARILFQDWTRLEQQANTASFTSSTASSETAAEAGDASLTDQTSTAVTGENATFTGPEAWKLAYPLVRSLLELSRIYGHLGMFQETLYYAEQAQKVAQGTGSDVYMAQCAAWTGFVYAKAGKVEKIEGLADEARSQISVKNASCTFVALVRQLGDIYHEVGDFTTEADMLKTAETMLDKMMGGVSIGVKRSTAAPVAALEDKMQQLSIKEKSARATRKTTRIPAAQARRSQPAKAKAPAKARSPVPEDKCLSALRLSILVSKADLMAAQKDWINSIKVLREVTSQLDAPPNSPLGLVAMARAFLGQSLDQMIKDPVFSVVQDSTLSFPAVCVTGHDKGSDRHSLTKPNPQRKGRSATVSQDRDGSKGRGQDYFESLKEAREYLVEAHSIAATTGDGGLVHRISGLLQTVVILLSAASAKKSVLGHPGYATCTMEMARNVTWRRERKALLLEKSASLSGWGWPEDLASPEPRRVSLGLILDMNQLQRDYIDIIPEPWSVISISLSENKHDLCISKLQAGQSPFVIRLPLERASSRDADSEVFNFQQGHAEMLELIKLANDTCHDKRDFSVKGARTAWWADREALDVRLRGLLENIEQVWLGGFKGIFSQHRRRSDLLARFQKSFTNVLDKYLPSRRQVRGKRAKPTPSKISLDPRILELFIGLGDATEADCDFEEALNDLLYFIVDILQFNGERNAYDEIDFDSMVVETFDALHAYHAAVKEATEPGDNAHTILILDKTLHCFPWESLPCMQEAAVSRVPSLACLRRLILEQRAAGGAGEDQGLPQGPPSSGHWVSPSSGSYILNPGADLKTTQETFAAPLASLPRSWKRVVSRAPTEDEFEAALAGSDVLLYFGHGSGSQYIRGRTVRKLDKCRAAVLLMGCSSATLADAGGFECHGPVWNYMLAGCPAAVGTLWDVTDRDIDRFAGRVLEEWGLVGRGTFPEETSARWKGQRQGVGGGARKKGGGSRKGKGGGGAGGECEAAGGASGGNASLVQAVTRARDACRFRYLTAAAVCVYGIPVYVEK